VEDGDGDGDGDGEADTGPLNVRRGVRDGLDTGTQSWIGNVNTHAYSLP